MENLIGGFKKFFSKLKKYIFHLRLIIYKKFFKKILMFKKNEDLIHIGSKNGGKSLIDKEYLYNSTIISLGAGEDISFDVEFASKYNSTVIICDPTPRAKSHFYQSILRLGKKNIVDYNFEDNQNPESYDLSKIRNNQLIYIDKAIHVHDEEKIKLFYPKNDLDVSLSISDWTNNYNKKGKFHLCETITLKKIMNDFNLKNLPLVKYDIEGSEMLVIKNMLQNKIFPKQLIVDFDLLFRPNFIIFFNLLILVYLLKKNKYRPIDIGKDTEFLFIRV